MKLFDSSPLIALLGNLDNPEILIKIKSLGYSLYIPFRVVGEVSNYPEKQNLAGMLQSEQIIILNALQEKELQDFRNRFYKLGKGESELILLAQKWKSENKSFCCIVDDEVARNVSEKLGLKCKGTIGLLKKLNEKNLITPEELDSFFKKLEEHGFRYKFK